MVFDLVLDSSVSSLLSTYGYIAMVVLMMIEGPATAFASGVLSAAGFFNPLAVIIVFISVRIVTDTLFYQAGRSGSKLVYRLPYLRSYAQLLETSEYKQASTQFFHNHFMLLFTAAKLLPIPNLATATSVAAGAFEVNRIKFYVTLILAQTILSNLLVWAGLYIGSASYTIPGGIFLYVLIPFLIVCLMYILRPYILRYLKSHSKLSRLTEDIL